MKENRIQEITTKLAPHAPVENVCYTNQEIVNRLVSLQEAMAYEVFAISHAEHFAARDILLHIQALATEYQLSDSDVYHRLKRNLQKLGYTIGSLKKGFTGERRTKEGLRVMNFDDGVQILYNLTLQEGDDRTEYDAIVVTPYGIFVVEAKNFSGTVTINEKGMLQRQDDNGAGYNLGENMNKKEYLLRNCLGDLASVPYQGLLLYVDERSEIISDYKQVPIVYCNTVASFIRGHDTGEKHLSAEEVQEIIRRINAHSVLDKYPCKVDCKQIIADFAELIAEIEASADQVNQANDCQPEPTAMPVYHEVPKAKPQPVKERKLRTWWPVGVGAASVLVGMWYLAKNCRM